MRKPCARRPPAATADDAQGLARLDLSHFQSLDPLLHENTKVLYELEFLMRIFYLRADGDAEPMEERELIRLRAVREGSGGQTRVVRLEITSEQYLFFMFVHVADAEGFQRLSAAEGINCSLEEFPALLLDLLRRCREEPESYEAELYIEQGSRARMEVHTRNELRQFRAIGIDFASVPDETLHANIAFRFKRLQAGVELLETRLEGVLGAVRASAPNLALALSAQPPRR